MAKVNEKLQAEILKRLEEAEKLNSLVYGDISESHVLADEILCDLLTMLGYHEVVKKFQDLEKWYE